MPATIPPITPKKGGFYKQSSAVIGKFRIRKPVLTVQLSVGGTLTTSTTADSSSIDHEADTFINNSRMDFSVIGGCKTPKKTGNFAHAYLMDHDKKEEEERNTEKEGQVGSIQVMTNAAGPIITNAAGHLISNAAGPTISNAAGPMITNAARPSKKKKNRQRNRKQSIGLVQNNEHRSESPRKDQSPFNKAYFKNKSPSEDSNCSPKKIFGISKTSPDDDDDDDFIAPSQNKRQSLAASSTSTMSISPKDVNVKQQILTEWSTDDEEKENGAGSDDAGPSSATSNACIRICENMDRLNAAEYLDFIFKRASDIISQNPCRNILPLLCKVLQKREVHADIEEKILEIRQDVALMETASIDELFLILSLQVIKPAIAKDFVDVKKTYLATTKIFS